MSPSPLQIATPSDHELLITRAFDAPRQAVFDALTQPALLRRWLLGPPGWSMPTCEVDPRVGGSIRYEWQNDNGSRMGLSGVFREVIAPERLVHTEIFDEDWTGGETRVTTVLSEKAGKTTVAMTILYASREARDAAKRSGMDRGMEAGYARLDEILRDG
jgi:uncharacterized protein YndB with AHSA1/START domain